VASVEASFDSKWSCYHCKKTYDRYDGPKKDRALRNMFTKKSCSGETERNYQLENVRFKKCPGNYTDTQVRYLVDWFMMYEKGVMPFDGPMADQPAKIIEIFELIQSIRDEKVLQQEKEDAMDARRNNSKSR
jgi:hypothetical protein